MPDKPRTRAIPKFVYNSNGLIVEFEFGKRWEIWRIIGALLKVWLALLGFLGQIVSEQETILRPRLLYEVNRCKQGRCATRAVQVPSLRILAQDETNFARRVGGGD